MAGLPEFVQKLVGIIKPRKKMELGAFSVSLNVKDLKASKDFYEKLGFTPFAGSMDKNYFIMKNGDTLIGIFQGMFEKTIMTFNPGWDQSAGELESFTDVREIQTVFKELGLELKKDVGESSSGPGSLMLEDPDGNTILIDQHR